jgi:hypothetical protein
MAEMLIDKGMTIFELARAFYMSVPMTRVVLTDMRRNVLPELEAICPRPTFDGDWKYHVLDDVAMKANPKLVDDGAKVMKDDNTRRLLTMLETSEPYAVALDGRSKRRKAEAEVFVNASRSALLALELIDISSNGEL